MKYNVIKETGIEYFEKEVKDRLEEGWKPVGGVCVLRDEADFSRYHYFQAMIKDE